MAKANPGSGNTLSDLRTDQYPVSSGLQLVRTSGLPGAAAFVRVGNQRVSKARQLVDLAFDDGVNLFDTANLYSSALAEEITFDLPVGQRDKA